ncbi:MAG: hypothetical protein HKN93_09085, partial [Acidimicrobiia bacterium]|nr:hypothetical protein [Acidimicrobiia bacterium]
TTIGTTTTIDGDLVLVSDSKGFSFSYPTDWVMEETFGDYVITAPSGGASSTEFQILLEDSDDSPVEAGEAYAEFAAAFLTNFELISQGEATVGGLPGYVIEYTAAFGTGGTDRYLEGYVSANGFLFNVVYVGPLTDYDTWLTDGLVIWNSFDFGG